MKPLQLSVLYTPNTLQKYAELTKKTSTKNYIQQTTLKTDTKIRQQ